MVSVHACLAHVALVGWLDDTSAVDGGCEWSAWEVATVLEGVQGAGAVGEGAAEFAAGHALAALSKLAVGSCAWLAYASSTVTSIAALRQHAGLHQQLRCRRGDWMRHTWPVKPKISCLPDGTWTASKPSEAMKMTH